MSSKKASKKPMTKPTKRDDLLKAKAKKPSKKKPTKAKTEVIDLTPITPVQVTVNDHSDKLAPSIEAALDKFLTTTPPKTDTPPAFHHQYCCDEEVAPLPPFKRAVEAVKDFTKSFFNSLKHL